MSQLLDEILSSENMKLAYKKVKANKGASGVDGISTDEVSSYLKEHWLEIKEQIKKNMAKMTRALSEALTNGMRSRPITAYVQRMSPLQKNRSIIPQTNSSSILQANRPLKSLPFFACLWCWMQQLNPKRRANIAYILDAPRKKTVSQIPWSSAVRSGKLQKFMCSRKWMIMIPHTAKPRRQSTTLIRVLCEVVSIFEG